MTTLSADACKVLSHQLEIAIDTTIQTLQQLEDYKDQEKYEVRTDKITNSLLGCIAMALIVQATIALETADKV